MLGGASSNAVAATTLSRAARVAWVTAACGVAAFVFVFSWLFRFNDPGGAFAGITDDHFFYLVRGWQILYGDLPVRDFVDHGAPLYYYIAAGVQAAFGRGTLSELLFSVTVLSISATLTWWLAVRASGSLVVGSAAALFHVILEPRPYNYPKIFVYAVGIPLLWRFIDRPGAAAAVAVACWTVVAFLFRHDHGLFLALATITALLTHPELRREDRARQAAVYAGAAAAFVFPYIVFIQIQGGLGDYVRDAMTWAAKDRRRAPVIWPGLFDEPGGVYANLVAWTYYLELLLPLVALALVVASGAAFRPTWPRAVTKMTVVAVLGFLLNLGFLRSPLAARLADPSVPHAIVIAWLAVATYSLLRSRSGLRDRFKPLAWVLRPVAVVTVGLVTLVLGVGAVNGLPERLELTSMTDGPGKAIERSSDVTRQLREEWSLEHWANREDRPDLLNLVLYLDACTKPDDRVFMQHYLPQVLGLARRAFAGGHADLRPGFFTGIEAQTLTLDRLRSQSVPVALLETGDEYANFRKAFPLLAEHFDREYYLAGTHLFDGRFGVQLFARRDATSTGRYAALQWPCFR